MKKSIPYIFVNVIRANEKPVKIDMILCATVIVQPHLKTNRRQSTTHFIIIKIVWSSERIDNESGYTRRKAKHPPQNSVYLRRSPEIMENIVDFLRRLHGENGKPTKMERIVHRLVSTSIVEYIE